MTDFLNSGQEKLKIAAQYAKRLCGYFPTTAASDYEIFLTGLVQLLAAYQQHHVESILSPLSGLPAKHKFLPSIAEIREALEDRRELDDRISAVQNGVESTLRSRKPDYDLVALPGPAPARRPKIEELREKYGDNFGINKKADPVPPYRTPRQGWKPLSPEELMKMGGLSKEQWNAFPEAPISFKKAKADLGNG